MIIVITTSSLLFFSDFLHFCTVLSIFQRLSAAERLAKRAFGAILQPVGGLPSPGGGKDGIGKIGRWPFWDREAAGIRIF